MPWARPTTSTTTRSRPRQPADQLQSAGRRQLDDRVHATAPDGTTVFQDQKASTGLVDVSQAGTYTLSADVFRLARGILVPYRSDRARRADPGDDLSGNYGQRPAATLHRAGGQSAEPCWSYSTMRRPLTRMRSTSSSVRHQLDRTTGTGSPRPPRAANRCSTPTRPGYLVHPGLRCFGVPATMPPLSHLVSALLRGLRDRAKGRWASDRSHLGVVNSGGYGSSGQDRR